jgi:uncharacterized membrane protein
LKDLPIADWMPLTFLYLLLLFAAGIFLVALIQVGVITVAFDKLGLSPQTGVLLLLGSLIGSGINIPVYLREHRPSNVHARIPTPPLSWGFPRQGFPGKTLIAVNVGGCLIPGGLSLYLLGQHPLNPVVVVLALAVVTAVSYLFSRPIPGFGIGMPVFVAPLVSALTALLFDPGHSAPLAYISGTLGVIIGADLLRLRDIDRLHAPVASIGGAGTFDAVFFTGIIAVLLA